jgi:hypothetical protein
MSNLRLSLPSIRAFALILGIAVFTSSGWANADKRKDQANDKATRGNEEQLPEEEPRGRKK